MIDTPSIAQSPAQTIAKLHLTIPRDQIKHIMGPAIGELVGAAAAQDMKPTGHVFAHHLRIEPDIFDFEICLPTAAPIAPVDAKAGRIVPGHFPAVTVARTIYHGPYEGLEKAWGTFDDWLISNGHTISTNLWEVYLQGPESGPDSSTWRTQLNRPISA